ncbi:DinB family protein [Ensifer sp. LC163]|uniref:DinB family protein n=1 Tax=Ensifer sp. LC163 TaxID=1120652 RepID=UPI00081361BA|nr:DinB family protein [Ensifer sp. LC163]OCP36640.1 diguanylate cyclase [Ensifer sp. LC163]
MLDHFRMFADYNNWANRRLYAAAAELTERDLRQSKGAFFGSVLATLNHILAADRIWMKRFTGEGDAPTALDATLHDDLASLAIAREREDARMIAWIDGLDDARLAATFTYTPLSTPVSITQKLGPTLAHVFNHQTHHRGQAHATLTALGRPSIVLDLAFFLWAEGEKWAS